MASREVSFLAFFLIWAKYQRWEVPALHVRMCQWLETCADPERVLMVFRGAAKSTIYAVYKAWKLYRNPKHRSLVWSADNDTAGMLTADTINVLRNHPLTRGMLPKKPGAKKFWVSGATDARNASMRAVGVNSNATGARADDVDFDDVEVPGNIETPEARLKIRNRINESTHIAVPDAQKTYIGTPHTHDSIYPERIAQGAAVLKIPLFAHVKRYAETDRKARYAFDFPVGDDGLYVLAGIYKAARMLVEGEDYTRGPGFVEFPRPPGCVIDICSMCAWPERFTRRTIEQRRKETRTLNGWDSQYMLEAKPIEEIRLDPERMIPYDMKPVLRIANRTPVMMLGNVQIVGAKCRWDCALGKIDADASAISLILTDAAGTLYWQFAEGLTGDLAQQCQRIRQLVIEYHIPSITVEVNGVGGFVPNELRKHLAGRALQGRPQEPLVCGVVEDHATVNKNKRILDAFEAPLSNRFLWAHVSVTDGPVWDQMKDWNPGGKKEQPDDYIDSAAGAIDATPVRIGRGHSAKILADQQRAIWRPDSGVHEVTLEA